MTGVRARVAVASKKFWPNKENRGGENKSGALEQQCLVVWASLWAAAPIGQEVGEAGKAHPIRMPRRKTLSADSFKKGTIKMLQINFGA